MDIVYDFQYGWVCIMAIVNRVWEDEKIQIEKRKRNGNWQGRAEDVCDGRNEKVRIRWESLSKFYFFSLFLYFYFSFVRLIPHQGL